MTRTIWVDGFTELVVDEPTDLRPPPIITESSDPFWEPTPRPVVVTREDDHPVQVDSSPPTPLRRAGERMTMRLGFRPPWIPSFELDDEPA